MDASPPPSDLTIGTQLHGGAVVVEALTT